MDIKLIEKVINYTPVFKEILEVSFFEKIKRYKGEKQIVANLRRISKKFKNNESGFGSFLKKEISKRRGYDTRWQGLYVTSRIASDKQLGVVVSYVLLKNPDLRSEYILVNEIHKYI